MKLVIYLLLICSALFACKKNGNENQWTVPKIKSASAETGSPALYYYDKDGRVIKIEDTTQKQEFIYEPSKVTYKITELVSNGIVTNVYDLNAAGYVTKKGNSNYSYTPEGYIRTIVNTSSSPAEFHQYYYNVTSGLLDSTVILKGSNWTQTIVYTYYTDKQETTGNENSGQSFFGKSLPNPVKSVTCWSPKQGNPNREIFRTEKYQYLYDAADRIVRASIQTNTYGQGASFSTIYTYY